MQSNHQALLWPQLLYAMAQIAGKDFDVFPKGRIWVHAIDRDHLRLMATDGVGLLTAKLLATHTFPEGAVAWLNPAEYLKKPAISACNSPQLTDLKPWDGAGDFLDLLKIQSMLAGPETRAPLDPARAARFFKAVSAICSRVDARMFKKVTFIRCPHLAFEGEVKGFLANLSIKGTTCR